MDKLILQEEFMAKAAPLVDKYNRRIDEVGQKIKDANNPILTFDDFDKAHLAMMLDNVDKVLKRYKKLKGLSDRTYSEEVGPFKKHAYNIISALYTTLDIRNITSFQPLSQKRGALYYMTFKYGSNKGKIRSGDTMFSPKERGERSGYYSSPIVEEEPLTFTYSTNSVAALEYYPLAQPDKISIVVAGATGGNGTYTYLSTSAGIYQLEKDGGGSAAATLDPNTGILTLTGVDASDATSAVGTYYWQSEKFSTDVPIPRVTISVEEKEVLAERRNLLIDLMLDVSYDYENQFSKNLNAEMESTVVQYLQNEISFRVLGEMYDGALANYDDHVNMTGYQTYTFYKTPPDGVTLVDNAQELFQVLNTMSTRIRNKSGRGWGNNVICGDGLLEYLRVLPPELFVRANVPKGDGPYFAGRLNGEYNIYYNPEYPTNEFVMVYKGSSWWEAPYYVGTYLPVMNSKFMLFPDMHGEQGYIGMEAYEYEFPLLAIKGVVNAGAKP